MVCKHSPNLVRWITTAVKIGIPNALPDIITLIMFKFSIFVNISRSILFTPHPQISVAGIFVFNIPSKYFPSHFHEQPVFKLILLIDFVTKFPYCQRLKWLNEIRNKKNIERLLLSK